MGTRELRYVGVILTKSAPLPPRLPLCLTRCGNRVAGGILTAWSGIARTVSLDAPPPVSICTHLLDGGRRGRLPTSRCCQEICTCTRVRRARTDVRTHTRARGGWFKPRSNNSTAQSEEGHPRTLQRWFHGGFCCAEKRYQGPQTCPSFSTPSSRCSCWPHACWLMTRHRCTAQPSTTHPRIEPKRQQSRLKASRQLKRRPRPRPSRLTCRLSRLRSLNWTRKSPNTKNP
jgi:hypothetical protein